MSNDTLPRKSSGSNFERLPAFRSGGIADAVSSKLVKSILPGVSTAGKGARRLATTPPNTFINRIANKTAMSVVDADNIMKLLPDLELGKQVLVSSIISPNNLMANDVTFTSTADDLGEAGPKMLKALETYFVESSYKIKQELAPDLEAMLFVPGGKARLILPESTIDFAINGEINMETYRDEFTQGRPRNFGVLGRSDIWKNSDDAEKVADEQINKLRFESAAIPKPEEADTIPSYMNLTVTDNINVLKLPYLVKKVRAAKLHEAYSGIRGISTEDADKKKDATAAFVPSETDVAGLYPERSYKYTPVITLKTLADLDRPTVGHPVIMDIPLESVIPIHSPGDPTNHIAYFVVVDKNGNPVHVTETKDWFADIQYQASAAREMSSQLLSQTRRGSEGRRSEDDEFYKEEAAILYQDVIEADLISRLKNGLLGEDVSIANVPEIFKMMFARACSRMQTQLVFVPKELMSYMAFDYNEYGVAEGLLGKTKILSSMRAVMLFADTITGMKNSVAHTELGIKLEPTDPEPEVTIEMIMHDYARTRQSSYPLSAANPVDIIQYFDNAGINVSISGHPAYPDSAVTVEPKQMAYGKVDTELQDSLKKQHLMAIGIAPETVELSMSVDFATSVVSSNILLAKRAMKYQMQYCEMKSREVQLYTLNSSTLRKTLKDIVEECKESIPALKDRQGKLSPEVVVAYFISSVKLELPKPDVARTEMQQTELDNFIKLLDTALPAAIDKDLLPESVLGKMAGNVELFTAAYRAHHIRRWMQSNNIMPELFEITSPKQLEDGKFKFDFIDEYLTFARRLGVAMSGTMKTTAKFVSAGNKVADAFEKVTGGVLPESGGSESTETSGGASDFDFDLGLEEPEEEETPPGPTQAEEETGGNNPEENPPEE